MIVAQNLSRRFGKIVAVDSVDFRIGQGRVVGFLGPNGAGKTTTIRMIAGFLSPTAGRVFVNGHDVATHPLAARRCIGYLPESTPLYGEMRVVEYLRFRARLFGIERRHHKGAIETAIRRCWLEDVRRRPIRELSKGYRQRVGLAATMLHEPPVLILDEPTVGLDPAQIREVRSLIRELAGRHTILLSTHILPEAELTCDEIIMINRGRIQAQGTIDELRQSVAKASRYAVETDSASAHTAISALAGVASVEVIKLPDGWHRLRVTPAPDAGDLRMAISGALAEQPAAIRELTREAPTLEQMFVELVSATGQAPGAQPVAAGEAVR